MTIEDGGPAFPHPGSDERIIRVDSAGNQAWVPPTVASSGMTLRDWFAGQALIGVITTGSEACERAEKLTGVKTMDVAAMMAYGFADAMLKARQS